MQFHTYARNRNLNAEGFPAWDYCLIDHPTTDFVEDDASCATYDIENSTGASTEFAKSMGDGNTPYPFLAVDGWEVYAVPVGDGTIWPEEAWSGWRFVKGYENWTGEGDERKPLT